MWKALFMTLFLGLLALVTSSPQYLGFGGSPRSGFTPRGGSSFPAYARNRNWAASSGRGISAGGRIVDYGVRSGSGGYRPAQYLPFSSKG
jgi:hypothetical protein